MCAYIHVYKYVCGMYECIYLFLFIHSYMYVFMYVCIFIDLFNAYICTYVCTVAAKKKFPYRTVPLTCFERT